MPGILSGFEEFVSKWRHPLKIESEVAMVLDNKYRVI